MQSVLGALLTMRYTAYFAKAFTQVPEQKMEALGNDAAGAIMNSFGGAADVAKSLPEADAAKLMDAAEKAFAQGSHLAIAVAVAVAAAGLVLVFVAYPKREREQEIEAKYAAADQAAEKPAGQAA